MNSKKNVEAIYPLSAMQEGMLFHTLYDPTSAMYFEQTTFLIQGQLEAVLFQQAWQRIVDRHSILRTAFVWQKQEKPLQVVFKQVELPWQVLDWQHLSATSQAAELELYLQEERRRGFKLTSPPLCRATLIRLGEDSYRFVWSHHHLLLDGWSLPVLLQEAFACYERLAGGNPWNPPPARPYRDFIHWLQQQPGEEAGTFWQETLRGFDTPTSISDRPAAPPAAAEQPAEYATYRFSLTAQGTDDLQALARQERLTFSSVVYGAWAILLQRYCRERDVLFGITVAGRPHQLEGVEQMVGLFINTVPLRLQVPPGTSLRDWLQTVQARQVGLRAHEHTPLQQIQALSEVPAGTNLFETLVVFENYPLQSDQLDRLPLQLSEFQAEERTNYPLTVAARLGDRLEITLYYDTRLFTRASVEQIATHLQMLLTHVPTHLSQPIQALPLLPESEAHRLLHVWNDTAASQGYGECVHRLVAERAERQPAALAISHGEHCLTYEQLESRANRLAHTLRAMGIGPERRVAVCMERLPEWFVAILAVWKAGGAYVPFEPSFPRKRMAFMLEDSGAAVLLTHSRWQKQLPAVDCPVLLLDEETSFAADDSVVDSALTLDNLAYIIYTSGSTGQPKGVNVTHRGLLNLINWHIDTFQVTVDSRASLLTNSAFDASLWESWPYLVAGASLHIPPSAEQATPPGLLDWLKASGITHSFMVTPLVETALQQAWPAEMPLQYLMTGGDQLRPAKPAGFPGQLINGYGPTEDTVVTTTYPVGDEALPPIGRPLANKQLYVLDEELYPVPTGVPGELFIGGMGLARGYQNLPARTAERFVPNPFLQAQVQTLAAESGESEAAIVARLPSAAFRLYRTGDLVRYRPDGNIEFMGRLDKQVQIAGYRIELGEIEATLAEHPAVEQALVTVWENRMGAKQLLAYFVSERKVPPSLRELERFLQQRLPHYMIPKFFFVLQEVPLMPNGKVDRQALPLPEESLPVDDHVVEPRTGIEQRLVDIWQQVLKVERLGIENNFFELGGDSILSIQLVASAGQAGLHFTVKQLFQYPTIAELAPHVSLGGGITAEQGDITGQVPLTPVQQWFFEQSFPQPHHFNQSFLLVEQQPLNPTWIEQAVNHLVRHHDALRLRYRPTDSGWEQAILPPGEAVSFSTIDLSEQADGAIPAAIERMAGEVQATLDLSDGPLMHCVWFDLGPTRPNRLLWVIHHLMVDGFSWRVLLEDLQTAYGQCRRGEVPRLPPKTTSFKYWSERLLGAVEEEDLFATERERWSAMLQQPAGRLPVDHPERAADNLEGTVGEVSAALTREETAYLLQDIPQLLDTEINDILLTALAQTLTGWMEGSALLVDLEGHGRSELFEDVDLSRTVGWFTSIYPVRLDVTACCNTGEALKVVKEQLRRIPNQGVGYGCLRYLGRAGDLQGQLSPPAAAEVRFNYLGQYDQNFGTEVALVPALEPIGPSVSPDAPRTHLLDIAGGVLHEQLRFTWMYSTALHRAETIERLVADYVARLREILTFAGTAAAPVMTPTDFPSANLDQQQLDQFLSSIQEDEQA